MPIRVLLADDHLEFRECLRTLLESQSEIEVIAEASTGWDAVAMAREFKPDIAVLDVCMRPLSGIQAIEGILHFSPRTAVLMCSMHKDDRYVMKSIDAGARGYVLKDSGDGEILEAIHSLSRGRIYFGSYHSRHPH
ncbi:MAG: response regulator transcription factor [Bryobacterales bacterium]|nr:response regulator transcription factor [Bryobacterales bacterium]